MLGRHTCWQQHKGVTGSGKILLPAQLYLTDVLRDESSIHHVPAGVFTCFHLIWCWTFSLPVWNQAELIFQRILNIFIFWTSLGFESLFWLEAVLLSPSGWFDCELSLPVFQFVQLVPVRVVEDNCLTVITFITKCCDWEWLRPEKIRKEKCIWIQSLQQFLFCFWVHITSVLCA